jgi:flavin-dependent dehydrogenase
LLNAGVYNVGLVGRVGLVRSRVGEAASPDVPYLLRAIGLPNDLSRLGHRPYYGNVSAWGCEAVAADFLRHGLDNGYHLDRDAFDEWLLTCATNRGASLIDSNNIQFIGRTSDGGWHFVLRDDVEMREISAEMLIVATGRAGANPLTPEARVHRLDDLIALTITVPDCASRFNSYSLIEAVEFGWWYSAPLPGAKRVFTLMTEKDFIRERSLLKRNQFVCLLRESKFLRSVGAYLEAGERVKAFPASTQYRNCAATRRWVAVGDALMALDPLASCGIGGALSDGIESAKLIARLLGAESDHERKHSVSAYVHRADATLRRFLVERDRIYGQESRWPHSPFWRARQRVTTSAPQINPFDLHAPRRPCLQRL